MIDIEEFIEKPPQTDAPILHLGRLFEKHYLFYRKTRRFYCPYFIHSYFSKLDLGFKLLFRYSGRVRAGRFPPQNQLS